jgi:hypothetical protein
MEIECGPNHDIRIFELDLPKTKRIGVIVSGEIGNNKHNWNKAI